MIKSMRNRAISPASRAGIRAGGRVKAVRPADVKRARSLLAGRPTYSRLAAHFGAISDPTRAAIVHLLLHTELCTRDLAIVLDISAPATSQHLRVLRDLRLVTARREGRLVLYRLDDAHVAQLVSIGLAHEAEVPQAKP